jgi:hypothetical protein
MLQQYIIDVFDGATLLLLEREGLLDHLLHVPLLLCTHRLWEGIDRKPIGVERVAQH